MFFLHGFTCFYHQIGWGVLKFSLKPIQWCMVNLSVIQKRNDEFSVAASWKFNIAAENCPLINDLSINDCNLYKYVPMMVEFHKKLQWSRRHGAKVNRKLFQLFDGKSKDPAGIPHLPYTFHQFPPCSMDSLGIFVKKTHSFSGYMITHDHNDRSCVQCHKQFAVP